MWNMEDKKKTPKIMWYYRSLWLKGKKGYKLKFYKTSGLFFMLAFKKSEKKKGNARDCKDTTLVGTYQILVTCSNPVLNRIHSTQTQRKGWSISNSQHDSKKRNLYTTMVQERTRRSKENNFRFIVEIWWKT